MSVFDFLLLIKVSRASAASSSPDYGDPSLSDQSRFGERTPFYEKMFAFLLAMLHRRWGRGQAARAGEHAPAALSAATPIASPSPTIACSRSQLRGLLPLEGLRSSQQAAHHDTGPLTSSCAASSSIAAAGLSPYPLLRLPRQPQTVARTAARLRPRFARTGPS